MQGFFVDLRLTLVLALVQFVVLSPTLLVICWLGALILRMVSCKFQAWLLCTIVYTIVATISLRLGELPCPPVPDPGQRLLYGRDVSPIAVCAGILLALALVSVPLAAFGSLFGHSIHATFVKSPIFPRRYLRCRHSASAEVPHRSNT